MRYLLSAAACSLLTLAAGEVRGDDGPLSDFYRSLNRWGRNVRQQLEAETSPTPSQKPKSRHKTSVKHHSSPSPSPEARSDEDAKPKKTKKTSSTEEETETSSSKHLKKAEKSEESSRKNAEPEPTQTPKEDQEHPSSVASLDPTKLKDFDNQPERVRNLIRSALDLTQKNLAYTYGSSDPASGGMDCSGFIYYILTAAGFKDVPRQSSDQYLWVRKNGVFHAVLSRNANTFELEQLRPGDLMFWSGTYKVERDVPITHVMIYLGKEKLTGKPVMVGASDGRSYDGVRRFGVSVFDFKLPNGTPNKNDPDLVARFEGYSSIPGLREGIYSVQAATPTPTAINNKVVKKPTPLTQGD